MTGKAQEETKFMEFSNVDASAPGQYTCLRPNATKVTTETWQYWVDDQVNGKTDGWYDYDDDAAVVVEQLHTEFQTNPSLSQRVVASGM